MGFFLLVSSSWDFGGCLLLFMCLRGFLGDLLRVWVFWSVVSLVVWVIVFCVFVGKVVFVDLLLVFGFGV